MESSLCEKPERHAPRRLSDHLGLEGLKQKVHSLVDKVYSRTNLTLAWERVRANRGTGGTDGISIEDFEANLEINLDRLHRELRDDTYQPQPVRRIELPKRGTPGKTRPLGIPSVYDRVCQQAMVNRLEPIFEKVFDPSSFGYRKGRKTADALSKIWREVEAGNEWIVDADLKDYLDTASYCPLVHEVRSKSSGCRAIALMRSPFCLPRITWTASSSPRLTRCNTVWRETPSAFIASRIGMKPSPASLLNRAMTSWVNRMRHGAPGVSCSPGMIPALSKRWRVEGATPSTGAAVLMVNSSPSACASLGSKHGISQCRRRLPTRPASKRWPYAVVRPWRLRMPAITASG